MIWSLIRIFQRSRDFPTIFNLKNLNKRISLLFGHYLDKLHYRSAVNTYLLPSSLIQFCIIVSIIPAKSFDRSSPEWKNWTIKNKKQTKQKNAIKGIGFLAAVSRLHIRRVFSVNFAYTDKTSIYIYAFINRSDPKSQFKWNETIQKMKIKRKNRKFADKYTLNISVGLLLFSFAFHMLREFGMCLKSYGL